MPETEKDKAKVLMADAENQRDILVGQLNEVNQKLQILSNDRNRLQTELLRIDGKLEVLVDITGKNSVKKNSKKKK